MIVSGATSRHPVASISTRADQARLLAEADIKTVYRTRKNEAFRAPCLFTFRTRMT